MRLQGIVGSTRSALRNHPEDETRIRRAAVRLLNELQDDLVREGALDTELLRELSAVREEFRGQPSGK